jgi:SAM-dependent methyltransferase
MQSKFSYAVDMPTPSLAHVAGEPSSVPRHEVTNPWDINATTRLAELQAGDPAYTHLTNLIIDHLERQKPGQQRIIDAGCGLGFLALALAQRGHQVIGIDPSEQSIAVAQTTHPTFPNLRFHSGTLEEYAAGHPGEEADAIIANMVLHSVTKLPVFMAAASKLLSTDGQLLATTPSMEYFYRKGMGPTPSAPQVFKRDFAIRDHDSHPEPVYFFYYPRSYIAAAANASRLKVATFFHLKDPVTRQPDDIEFWRFQPDDVTP